MKVVTKTINNETKKQKEGFSGILLGTLGASLLANMLTGKEMVRAGYQNKEGEGMLRTLYESSIKKSFDCIPSFNKL